MAPAELSSIASGKEEQLARVITAIADAVQATASVLRTGHNTEEVGSSNPFGDRQLQVDVAADDLVFQSLRASGAVATASSEERPEEVDLGGHGYSVAFDPLDGSSIVGANFAVGAIFGIWPGSRLLGVTARQQAAAAYAVYGPRTTLVLASPGASGQTVVQEFTLGQQDAKGVWSLTLDNITIGEKKVFAPANLRAAAENTAYRDYVAELIAQKYTLRYTGGFVPDVHHILTKGGGLFLNPIAASAPAKLRMLYECAPLAYIVEAAGGACTDGAQSLLDVPISALDARTAICLGSVSEVYRAQHCLHAAA